MRSTDDKKTEMCLISHTYLVKTEFYHSEGTGQAGKLGREEIIEVQQGEMQILVPKKEYPQGPAHAGDNHQESSSVKKDLGVLEQETEAKKKANTILDYIRKNVGHRLRELIFLLH